MQYDYKKGPQILICAATKNFRLLVSLQNKSFDCKTKD